MTPTDWLLVAQTAALGVTGLAFLFRGEAKVKVLEAKFLAHEVSDEKNILQIKEDLKEIRRDVRRIHEKLGGG